MWLAAIAYLYTELTTGERAMGAFILPMLVALQAVVQSSGAKIEIAPSQLLSQLVEIKADGAFNVQPQASDTGRTVLKPAVERLAAAGFALDADVFRWRGRTAGPDELRDARRVRLHSIGSCSFFEPVEELEALGVLPL